MRHQRSGKKLGRDSAHRKALYANLTGALIEHGRIKTTVTKAKAVKPIAEQMITLGRRGDLHARRQAVAFLRSKDVVHKLFAEVAPRFARAAGRLLADRQARPAPGDAAEMVYLELVDEPLVPRSRTNGADAEPVEAPVATAAAETVDEAATEDDVRDAAADAERAGRGGRVRRRGRAPTTRTAQPSRSPEPRPSGRADDEAAAPTKRRVAAPQAVAPSAALTATMTAPASDDGGERRDEARAEEARSGAPRARPARTRRRRPPSRPRRGSSGSGTAACAGCRR